MSDLTPDEKVAGYLKSKVIETNLLAGKIDKDGFDKSNIENRKNEIIDFCLENF